MVSTTRLCTLVLALLLCAAAPVAARPLRMLKHDVQIHSNRYVIAFNTRIASRMTAFYASDAVFQYPGTPRTRGRLAITAAYARLFAHAPRLRSNTTSITRVGSGRFEQTGSYALTRRLRGRRSVTRGRFRRVWRRVGSRFVLVSNHAMWPRAPRSVMPRVQDVRVELTRYVIAFNRREAGQLGAFYTGSAVAKLVGAPRARGRNAIVAVLRRGFASGVVGVRVTRVVVTRRTDGGYVTRGHSFLRVRANGRARVLRRRFRIVWRFVGRSPRMVDQNMDM